MSIVPRAAASACIFRGDTVLLVQRGTAPNQGAWSLPGGRIEAGETAATAAAREVAEETGLTVTLHGLVAIDDVFIRDGEGSLTHHYVIAVFAGTATTGNPVAADDARDARFVPLAEIAGLGVTPRVHELISSARAQHRAMFGGPVPSFASRT